MADNMSDAQAFSQNFTYAQDSPSTSGDIGRAVSEAMEARQQYSSRSVYAPEGRLEGVHYRYTSYVSRSQSHTRSRGHHRQSSYTAHPTFYTTWDAGQDAARQGSGSSSGRGIFGTFLAWLSNGFTLS